MPRSHSPHNAPLKQETNEHRRGAQAAVALAGNWAILSLLGDSLLKLPTSQDYLLDFFKSKNMCALSPCSHRNVTLQRQPSSASFRLSQFAARRRIVYRQASVCEPVHNPLVNFGRHQAYFGERECSALRSCAWRNQAQMVGAGVCEWTSPERNRAFIWWKSPEEWANDLHRFAMRTGEVDVVETMTTVMSEAGSPLLSMSEEEVLRICQAVRAFLFLCCACQLLSVCGVNRRYLQLVSKNRAVIMASDDGEVYSFEPHGCQCCTPLQPRLAKLCDTHASQAMLEFDFTGNSFSQHR